MIERIIQNEIRENVKDIAVIFRMNVGLLKGRSGRLYHW